MNHSTVTATAGKAGKEASAEESAVDGSSYGIYALYDFTVLNHSTVQATAGDATDESYGLYVCDQFTVAESTVAATAGNANGSSYGIYVSAYDFIVSGSSITAAGGDAIYKSIGISVNEGNLFTANADITATAGKAAGKAASENSEAVQGDSYGIYVLDGTFTDMQSKITAGADTATGNSYGIGANSTVSLTDTHLTVKGDSGVFSTVPTATYSVYCRYKTTADGTLTAGDPTKDLQEMPTYLYVMPGYTVAFNANGGSSTAQGTISPDGKITLPEEIPTLEGHTFKGWALNSTDGTLYAAGDTVKLDGDTTFVAVWEANAAADSNTDDNTNGDNTNVDPEPTVKNGLPTGAIVAIVIGGVVILGIGGFCIFWFVIKKKKWSDLFHK